MKPTLIPTSPSIQALHYDDQAYPYFYNPWHYHPELELTLIVSGHGQRIVGDHMEPFKEGDLVLVGSQLPHLWKCDASFYKASSGKMARAIVVKFLPDFLGASIWKLKEFSAISKMVETKAKYGMQLEGDLKKSVMHFMLEMSQQDQTERILQTIQILHTLSQSQEYKLLASPAYLLKQQPLKEKDSAKIDQVIAYLMSHYQQEISLEDVARHIHMNKNAFCRFFRRKTGKTMVQFLLEIRVGMACQKLQDSNDTIDFISHFVGFHNISNFNRSFKSIVGETPSRYRSRWKLVAI
jgi:AraC-like DNA-binding protein